MRRMSAQDAAFLHIEDDVSHMHIGAVAILQGPPPAYEALAERVWANLPDVPRYRQRVHFVPLALGRPVWVDDPQFDLGFHLRRTAVPAPGGAEQLQLLIGRLMSQQLDRHRPLWEMWMIEGLDENRWGLLTKVHHSMVDGVSGAELLSAILDEQPDPAVTRGASWRPEREPSGVELAARALAFRAVSPLDGVRTVLASPRGALERALGTAAGPAHDDRGARAATDVVAERPDRAASMLGLGALAAVRRQGGANGVRRHGQRRRPVGDRRRLSRAVDPPRRDDGPGGALTRAGVGARRPRTWHVQQPRVGDLRRPAGGDRRSGETPGARCAG